MESSALFVLHGLHSGRKNPLAALGLFAPAPDAIISLAIHIAFGAVAFLQISYNHSQKHNRRLCWRCDLHFHLWLFICRHHVHAPGQTPA